MLLALVALTGCRKQAVPDDGPAHPEESQEMVIGVKSNTPDSKFTFLFWHKEDFDRGLLNPNYGPAAPYCVSSPSGNIGDYIEDNKYNTGRVYPENYGIAVCTGFGPYREVYRQESTTEDDYRYLSVSEPGVTDVVVSENYLEGSSLLPFSGDLKFFHPQIRLSVFAKTASTMTKYIKDLSFTIDKDNLLSSLAWSPAQKGYRPSIERPQSNWTSGELNEHINSSDEKKIGSVYVVPSPSSVDWEMSSIDLTISGKIGISNAVGSPYSDFNMTVPVIFKDAYDNNLTLKLNDSYEIYLIFDEDQIEVTAVKVPWEEGGNVLVPIHPIPES